MFGACILLLLRLLWHVFCALGKKSPQSFDGPWWSLRNLLGILCGQSHPALPFRKGKVRVGNRIEYDKIGVCVSSFSCKKVGIQSWICFCFVAFLHFAFGCLGSSKHRCRVPKHRLILGPVHLDVSSVAWQIQQWAAWTYVMVCLLRFSFAIVNEISRSDPTWDQWTLQLVCVFLKFKL